MGEQISKRWVKEAILSGNIEAINEVMIPALDRLMEQNRQDHERLESRIEKIETVVDGLVTKIDHIDRRLFDITDHQAKKLDDHERRLNKVELAVSL